MHSSNLSKLYLTNIFIIDWDDTLFPTTWVIKNDIKLSSTESVNNYKLYFLELDKTLSKFLESLNNVGDIYIVTNANLKWIKSCIYILPETQQVIINNNIRIISARDLYSDYKLSPTEWKIYTFQDILNDIVVKIKNKMSKNTYLNIVSFGDAMYEYMALVSLDSYFKDKNEKCINYLLKNISFIEKPNFDNIIEQMQILSKNKNAILDKISFIDIKFKN